MLPTLSISLLITVPALLALGGNAASSQKTPEAAAPASPPTPPPARPPSPLGDPTWAVGLRVYQALRSSSDSQNTVFSPLLLASSLGALGGGSSGSTSSQLRDLLKTPSPSSGGEELLSGALKTLGEANGSSFHLHSASAVFSKEAPPVDQAFVKDIQARFRVQYQPLWKGDSQADLKQLHAWGKAGLGGLEAVPLGAKIQAKAGALILANALRFKGLWGREFSMDRGDKRTFLGKKYTQVPIMHRAGLYRHYEDMENMVQVLELGLWGGGASVLLLLPFHVESLSRLDKLLSLELISIWLDKSTLMSAAVTLPTANITCTLSLKDQLTALGLSDAWDQETADFSGVSGANKKSRLHLEAVLHWASLELGPEAGEGAADLADERVEGRPKLFYADHPFVVLVRDNATGALLLMGALDHAKGEALHDEL